MDKRRGGKSRIDNPQTLAISDTQGTGRRQTKHKITTQRIKLTRKESNTDLIKNEGQAKCLSRVSCYCLFSKVVTFVNTSIPNPLYAKLL